MHQPDRQLTDSNRGGWLWLLPFSLGLLFVALLRYRQRRESRTPVEFHAEIPLTPPQASLADFPPFLQRDPDQGEPAAVPDDLKQIDGIGPVYEQVLNAGGIFTFAQLIETPLDELEALFQDHSLARPETWIDQARELGQSTQPAPDDTVEI